LRTPWAAANYRDDRRKRHPVAPTGPTAAASLPCSNRMSSSERQSPAGARSEAVDARYDVLLVAALDLAAEHDLDQILRRMVRCAAEVADARFAALGVYDDAGRIERFIHHGVDEETVARIGSLPQGRGLLGDVILADGPIRLADLTADPRSAGVPRHHPAMRTFLGVPVRLGSRRFGNLYLTEKRGGEFDADDERFVVTLAAFAAAAIDASLLVSAEREQATAKAALAEAEERARADRHMLSRVIDAQEAERGRVARDLHDQIGQSLTSVLLGLRLVIDSLAQGEPDLADARAHADEVRGLVVEALSEVRQLAYELRPTVLDDVGLVAAVRRLAAELAERHGVKVHVALDGLHDDSRFASELETVVYRVVQEALTNVARHAAASHATVSIGATEGRLRALVVDDGVGFAPARERPTSLGLAGMVERATLVGGRVDITSVPATGTTVRLDVPVG
jgi:two-component system, NarL family, sensor histidine kinase DevS